MNQTELMKKFLELEDEDEEIVEAWELFIKAQKGFRDAKAGIISTRERDTVQRQFGRYIKKKKLRMLDDEDGLKAHELAIVKGEKDASMVHPLNSFDIWLLTDFNDICAAWLADNPQNVEGFPDLIIEFLKNPYIDDYIKERLIEKDRSRGEILFKTILDDRSKEVNVLVLLEELYKREGKLAEAEVEYKRFLNETDDEVIWAHYGEFLERQGRYKDALEAFKNCLEIRERLGEEKRDIFFEEVKAGINRVERMIHLEGEEAEKAREYQDAMWLIEDVREFAEDQLQKDLAKAQEEYEKDKDKEVKGLQIQDLFAFLNWFLFSRKLGDGRTPGMLYAEEKGLSTEIKDRIQELGNPVEGTFEVIGVNHASFTLTVKDLQTSDEYTLRGNMPEIQEGQTLAGKIYPWGDFYISIGDLRAQDEASSQDVRRRAEESPDESLLEEPEEETDNT
jgi:tetratricopeptide (TPR) repeat protein